MNIESHKRALKESLEEIRDSIQRGMTERQRTIGFHCSVAAADMLEIYLHQKGLIDPGASIKHDLFSSARKATGKLPEFENKKKLLKLMADLERKRNLLCYGKPQTEKLMEDFMQTFNRIKAIFKSMGVDCE